MKPKDTSAPTLGKKAKTAKIADEAPAKKAPQKAEVKVDKTAEPPKAAKKPAKPATKPVKASKPMAGSPLAAALGRLQRTASAAMADPIEEAPRPETPATTSAQVVTDTTIPAPAVRRPPVQAKKVPTTAPGKLSFADAQKMAAANIQPVGAPIFDAAKYLKR